METGKLTYSSTQETECAGCGKLKHTPLRVDWMGGYVCLTCIDKAIHRAFTALEEIQEPQENEMDVDLNPQKFKLTRFQCSQIAGRVIVTGGLPPEFK